MPEDIERLLQRRPDLSTFLVHLSRDSDVAGGQTARQNLIEMLKARRIVARTAYGMARDLAAQDAEVSATQRCVCFTETPLEQVWMMTREIDLRQIRLQPYGLAFTKVFGRRRGVNPVWYLDITPGHDWLTNAVNSLVEISRRGESVSINSPPPDVTGALAKGPVPANDPILQITPFIEQMGPIGGGSKKEFWWEREWRKVGDFTFSATYSHVVAAFVPEADHDTFRNELAVALVKTLDWVESKIPLLDPEWGLERMIARLAHVDDADVGPFTS